MLERTSAMIDKMCGIRGFLLRRMHLTLRGAWCAWIHGVINLEFWIARVYDVQLWVKVAHIFFCGVGGTGGRWI